MTHGEAATLKYKPTCTAKTGTVDAESVVVSVCFVVDDYDVEVQVTIPLRNGSVTPERLAESVDHVIADYDIPVYLHELFTTVLTDTVNDYVQNEKDAKCERAMKLLRSTSEATSPRDIERNSHNEGNSNSAARVSAGDNVMMSNTLEVARAWATCFRNTHEAYAPPSARSDTDDDSKWPLKYHALVHSPSGTTLLELEKRFDSEMHNMRLSRKREVLHQRRQHAKNIEDLKRDLGSSMNNDILVQLNVSQRGETQLLRVNWESKLMNLMDTQRRQLRQWIEAGDYNSPLPVDKKNVKDHRKIVKTSVQRQEESFSIQLGAQRKTSHLLRLICSDTHDLLSRQEGPEMRLLTAMSLYSDTFNAVVLLVDLNDPYKDNEGQTFIKLCERTTEFHFQPIRRQIAKIREQPSTLQPGDFYTTRHSNLNNIPIVYHLVVDQNVYRSDMNQRSPILAGIRNIMLSAFQHNVATLTVPLLLLNTITLTQWKETMDSERWCRTRAELVLKAVKGYMIECSSWSTSNTARTMQFLLPADCTNRFDQFATQLDAVFRMVTPLNLQTKN
eukprot:CFRG4580T1